MIDVTHSKLTVAGSTLEWWLKTNPKVLASIISEGASSGLDEKKALESFIAWIKGFEENYEQIKFWGNGILFDNNIIREHCIKAGLTYPIAFYNDMDVRTILNIASRISKVSEKDIKAMVPSSKAKKHNALYDCHFEMKYVNICYDILAKLG